MAGRQVKVTLDQRAINHLLRETTDASAHKAATIVRDRARLNLLRKNRHKTGTLDRSIRIRMVKQDAHSTTYNVGSTLEYAGYQETGFGPVYPVRAKFLVFVPKGAHMVVFAKKTRGLEGAHYLRDAQQSLTMADYLPGAKAI